MECGKEKEGRRLEKTRKEEEEKKMKGLEAGNV